MVTTCMTSAEAPTQLVADIRTFFGPAGRLVGQVNVNVGVDTVWFIASSLKSYQWKEVGEFVVADASRVIVCPAYGCCCSGNPPSGPVGLDVKRATGTEPTAQLVTVR